MTEFGRVWRKISRKETPGVHHMKKEVRIVKRILTAGFCCMAVTVFFTGCSSLMGSMEVDVDAIQSSAASEVMTNESGENRLGITDEKKKTPDYFETNMTEKFKDLKGKAAFRIKDGHSAKPEDIESFQIADLRDGDTFVYGYTTLVAEGDDAGKPVHCGAFYNYQTEELHVFHEKIFSRDEEDEESFFLQLCDSTGDIFVYDNGHAWLYDSAGTREKFHADVEGFVRKQFQDVFSVSVDHAVTDGQNRIYLEVSIEKEAVEVPEGDEVSIHQETIDKEQIAEESEDLDGEVEGKVESRILVYEFRWINSGMDQVNEAFEDQKKAWISMTEGKEFTEEPDPYEDWEKAVAAHPDWWGAAYLGGMGDIRVYQWKEEPDFQKEDGITDFLSTPGSYVNFRDVKEDWILEGLFIPLENKYSELFGKTETFRYYNPQTIEREYTIVWEETVTNGDETSVVEHSETRTQTLGKINNKRYAPLQNAYVESYWAMDPKKAVSLGKCVGGEIQCTGEDEKVRWIQPGGDLKDTPYKVTENIQAGAFTDEGNVYYVEFGLDFMAVRLDESHGGDGDAPDEAHGGDGDARPEVIPYRELAGAYEQGDSAHDAILQKKLEEDLPEVDSVYGSDYYTDDQVLHARLNLNTALAVELAAKGGGGVCELVQGGSEKGYLLTSQEKGLVYYAPASGRSAVLEGGSWFRSWKNGENWISVGFLKGDASYSGSDLAFARVYEYNLSELCNDGMKTALENIKKAEEEAAIREAEEASRAEETRGQEVEEQETVQDPLDRWNEEFKEKYEATYPAE